ncbi:tetratricopeptide repeat protein [Cyanobacteria bacterium FACHB-63]|nr:tetratricopeptide repeat protein [Cyanobacteria bacterium FACHB-63]
MNMPLTAMLQLEMGKVTVLEAESGQARQDYLQRSLAQVTNAETWLLRCDRTEAGPWAGLADLLTQILPQVQHHAPELITQHDYELTRVLPALQRSLPVRYPSLTDIAPQQEQIRNYPADRAFRIIHGIIDFLAAWFEQSQSNRLIIACDRYDDSGGLVRIFFTELLRRCGKQLNLSLIIAIAPEADPDVVGKFDPSLIAQRISLDLPHSATSIDLQAIKAQVCELQQRVDNDAIEQEIHLPRLIHYLKLCNQPEQVLTYQIKAAALYTRRGFYEDGLDYAQAALAQLKQCHPDGEKHWQIDSLLYTCYVALDKPNAAFAVLEAAMQRTNTADDRFRGCFMMAMLYIRELEERDIAKAEAYLEQGLIELARTTFSEEEKLFHTTFNRNGLALIRYRQGRHQEAVELCQWCYQQVNAVIQPDQHRLYRSVLLFNIAQVYDFIGNYAEAIQYFTAAMELDPNYSEYYNSRGNLYFKLNQPDDALDDYKRAVELSAPYPEVWANIGQSYRRLGNWTAAVDAYSRALDLQPQQFSVLVARAQVLEMLEQPESALADYSAAIAIDPTQPLVLANRAILHYGIGQVSAALNDLNQAIALAPEIADLYQNRAIALTSLGRSEAAIQDLRTYLQLCPDAEDYTEVESQMLALRSLN